MMARSSARIRLIANPDFSPTFGLGRQGLVVRQFIAAIPRLLPKLIQRSSAVRISTRSVQRVLLMAAGCTLITAVFTLSLQADDKSQPDEKALAAAEEISKKNLREQRAARGHQQHA